MFIILDENNFSWKTYQLRNLQSAEQTISSLSFAGSRFGGSFFCIIVFSIKSDNLILQSIVL